MEFETNENEVLPLLRAVMVAKGEVQSCCFANQTYCFFCRSRCRPRSRCLSSLLLARALLLALAKSVYY